MKKHGFPRRGVTLAWAAALFAHLAFAQSGNEHWVTTWATALRAAPPLTGLSVGQPATPAQQAQLGFNNQTIRMIVPASIGGRRVRIHLSNAFSTGPLVVGAAHLALHAKESAIVQGSDRVLTFGGKPGFTLPAGAAALSDPVDLEVPPLGELAVSLYLPGVSAPPSYHQLGLHTTYVSKQGDATGQSSLGEAATTQSWYWLQSADVLAPAQAAAIVAFGDSITDGARSTPDTDASWPSRFTRRLAASRDTARYAVLNEGIAGNRILRDGVGPNALARFDIDALAHLGSRWLVFLEGINDIGRGTGPGANPADAVTADDLIAGMRQVIERAHSHGIQVMGATLTPYRGAAYFSEQGEAIRQNVNTWIRTARVFDAFVDFDAATRDAAEPSKFRAEFDSGDHLHPNDAGYNAMANAIDLAVFTPKAVSASAR